MAHQLRLPLVSAIVPRRREILEKRSLRLKPTPHTQLHAIRNPISAASAPEPDYRSKEITSRLWGKGTFGKFLVKADNQAQDFADTYAPIPESQAEMTGLQILLTIASEARKRLKLLPNLTWRGVLPHVLTASLAAISFGYHMGILNGTMGAVSADIGITGNTVAQGLVASLFLLGAFVGCGLSSTLADSAGRRATLQLGGLPIMTGTLLSAFSSSLLPMLTGRLLVGLGLGLSTPTMALYVSEISSTDQRGLYGGLCGLATCLGFLLVLLVSMSLGPGDGESWRLCFLLGSLPPALLTLGSNLMSESPRWLIQKSRFKEAECAADSLWGHEAAKKYMADLSSSSAITTTVDGTSSETQWAELFRKPSWKPVSLGASLFALQQLSGINAVFIFSSTIFEAAGVQSHATASLGLGIVNLFAALLSVFLMDRAGRKTLMSWSFLGMGVAMALQALFQGTPALQFAAPFMSLAATITYVAFFTLGAGPIPALLLPEILPTRIRAKAMALAMCVHWIFNFLVGLSFLPLLQAFGPSLVSTFFSVVCFAAWIFTEKCIIETRGKSLEEIQQLLHLTE